MTKIFSRHYLLNIAKENRIIILEIRCADCGKLLFRGWPDRDIEIKCSRCKTVNLVKVDKKIIIETRRE